MSRGAADNDEMSWAGSGRCAGEDPELFFPQRGQDPGPAKELCLECPVRAQCLSWAIETGQRHGIWGGMTEGQRRRLRRPPVAVVEGPVRHLQLVR